MILRAQHFTQVQSQTLVRGFHRSQFVFIGMATNRLEANWADRFVSAVEIAFVWEEASLGFSHIGPQFKLQPFGSGVSSLLSLEARGITISDDLLQGQRCQTGSTNSVCYSERCRHRCPPSKPSSVLLDMVSAGRQAVVTHEPSCRCNDCGRGGCSIEVADAAFHGCG